MKGNSAILINNFTTCRCPWSLVHFINKHSHHNCLFLWRSELFFALFEWSSIKLNSVLYGMFQIYQLSWFDSRWSPLLSMPSGGLCLFFSPAAPTRPLITWQHQLGIHHWQAMLCQNSEKVFKKVFRKVLGKVPKSLTNDEKFSRYPYSTIDHMASLLYLLIFQATI